MIKIVNRYPRNHWVQLKEELKDAFQHANSRVYMYTASYLERLCRDQLKRGNIGLKALILAYDNISCILINKGALAENSVVEMLLRALLRYWRPKKVMKLELDPRDPWTFKYDKLQHCVLDKGATADTLTHLHWDGAHKVPGISPYSIPTGVPLPQMVVVLILPPIPNEETLAPAQATKAIPIAKAEYTIDTKKDNMTKAFEALTFQLSQANEPRYGGYQTGRVYTIEVDHPPSYPHQWSVHVQMHPWELLTTNWDPITSSIHGKD